MVPAARPAETAVVRSRSCQGNPPYNSDGRRRERQPRLWPDGGRFRESGLVAWCLTRGNRDTPAISPADRNPLPDLGIQRKKPGRLSLGFSFNPWVAFVSRPIFKLREANPLRNSKRRQKMSLLLITHSQGWTLATGRLRLWAHWLACPPCRNSFRNGFLRPGVAIRFPCLCPGHTAMANNPGPFHAAPIISVTSRSSRSACSCNSSTLRPSSSFVPGMVRFSNRCLS